MHITTADGRLIDVPASCEGRPTNMAEYLVDAGLTRSELLGMTIHGGQIWDLDERDDNETVLQNWNVLPALPTPDASTGLLPIRSEILPVASRSIRHSSVGNYRLRVNRPNVFRGAFVDVLSLEREDFVDERDFRLINESRVRIGVGYQWIRYDAQRVGPGLTEYSREWEQTVGFTETTAANVTASLGIEVRSIENKLQTMYGQGFQVREEETTRETLTLRGLDGRKTMYGFWQLNIVHVMYLDGVMRDEAWSIRINRRFGGRIIEAFRVTDVLHGTVQPTPVLEMSEHDI